MLDYDEFKDILKGVATRTLLGMCVGLMLAMLLMATMTLNISFFNLLIGFLTVWSVGSLASIGAALYDRSTDVD